MERRRPPWLPGKPHRIVLPRGLPGIGIVSSALGRWEVVPAQCRARHAPVSGLFAFYREHEGMASTGRAVLDQCSVLRGDAVGWDVTPNTVKGGNLGQPR